MLDTDEYIHLALHASRQGDTHAALAHLKDALQGEPGNVVARYLLAAEHAEIGLYERAIIGMEEVLSLDPAIEVARFQLGLLYLQTNQPEKALSFAFSVLAESAQDGSLALFALAYEKLIRDEDKAGAATLLQEGMATCKNEYLVKDMGRVLASLQATPVAAATDIPSRDEPAANAFMLDAYRDPSDTH